MKWSLTVGKIFNINFKVHFSFILILLWIAISGIINKGLTAGLLGTFFVLCIFICVLIHEFCHSLLARKYNIEVDNIILLPIGGISNIKNFPEDPKQEIFISIIGPFSNIIISLLTFIILKILGFSWTDFKINAYSINLQDFLNSVININLTLAGFNLIPAFPMDGGRVLRGIIALKTKDFSLATKIASSIGQGIAIIIIFWGFLYNIWLLFIGFFVYIGAGNEEHIIEIKDSLKDITAEQIMSTELHILSSEDDFTKIFSYFFHGFQNDFPVIDNEKLTGVLTRNRILAVIHEKGLQIKIKDIMETDFSVISPDSKLSEIYSLLNVKDRHIILPVVKENKFLGIVTLENISRYLMVHSAFKK